MNTSYTMLLLSSYQEQQAVRSVCPSLFQVDKSTQAQDQGQARSKMEGWRQSWWHWAMPSPQEEQLGNPETNTAAMKTTRTPHCVSANQMPKAKHGSVKNNACQSNASQNNQMKYYSIAVIQFCALVHCVIPEVVGDHPKLRPVRPDQAAQTG